MRHRTEAFSYPLRKKEFLTIRVKRRTVNWFGWTKKNTIENEIEIQPKK